MSEPTISGTTGEICPASGIYCCVSIGHGEIVIHAGEQYPVCLFDEGHETVWVLRRELPSEEIENEE